MDTEKDTGTSRTHSRPSTSFALEKDEKKSESTCGSEDIHVFLSDVDAGVYIFIRSHEK